MEYDMAQGPGEAALALHRGGGVVRLGVVGDEGHVLVLHLGDQPQLLVDDLVGQLFQVVPAESLGLSPGGSSPCDEEVQSQSCFIATVGQAAGFRLRKREALAGYHAGLSDQGPWRSWERV